MAFPQLNTKGTNYEISPQMHSLLDQKLEPLGKLLDGKKDLKCQVELEKIGDHQSGKIYRAEVNLYADGTLFRAESTCEQMEQSIDDIRDELKRELRRANSKEQSLIKRGGKAIKDMLRFGG